VSNREDGSPEHDLESHVGPAFDNLNAILNGCRLHSTPKGMGVTWLYGFQFEIKIMSKASDLI
jgi:hypothetical protein